MLRQLLSIVMMLILTLMMIIMITVRMMIITSAGGEALQKECFASFSAQIG